MNLENHITAIAFKLSALTWIVGANLVLTTCVLLCLLSH
jgi:hypothetical protein